MKLHNYQAFGVKIVSSILLPELKPDPDPDIDPGLRTADVMITMGKVPMNRGGAGENKGYYQGEKDQLIFRIKNVGSYQIRKGREIMIEPADNAKIKELRLFLLGSAFGALLWQRGGFPIHGSAVKVKESCFIITGPQKAGKSTLAAAFAQDGYQILTDDIAPVYFDREGDPWAYPSYPQQKLWQDSLELLGKKPASFSRVFGRINKYALPLKDGFCQRPQRVTAIYEIRKADCKKVSLAALEGLDKLELIMNNVYRYGFAEVMGYKENLFRQAAALAQKAAVLRVLRPQNLLSIKEEKMYLRQDLAKRGIL